MRGILKMIQNKLTLEILDRINEITIEIALENVIFYKLYRIKEIYNYDTLFEYDAYSKYCDEIKKINQKFIEKIENNYEQAIKDLSTGKAKEDTRDELKQMDKLIYAGNDFNKAVNIIFNNYNKRG